MTRLPLESVAIAEVSSLLLPRHRGTALHVSVSVQKIGNKWRMTRLRATDAVITWFCRCIPLLTQVVRTLVREYCGGKVGRCLNSLVVVSGNVFIDGPIVHYDEMTHAAYMCRCDLPVAC